MAFWHGESAPTGSVPLDFTNHEVVSWQVSNQSRHAMELGYTAMAFDNYGTGAREGANVGKACGVIQRNGSWTPIFSGDVEGKDEAYADATVDWLERAKELMAVVTPGLGIVPNVCIDHPDADGNSWAGNTIAA